METKVTSVKLGSTIDPHGAGLAGTMIAGRYKLIHQLGMGGMGAVWLAEQTEPVVRQVALKVIKPGMDSERIIGRFEAERQALALMDHPNIARVLDGGLTRDLRPYFVMELVRGVPITDYCDTAKLDLRQRLEIFVQVCQAVQHAHQKGIIHRDLKPGNILVTLVDGKPLPKVIDFGVAKALHQKLTDRPMVTEVGSVVGTLEYMSPEQADLTALDIDTRSDIYSLGVILYELLTGLRPFDSAALRRVGLAEMLRIIKEEEPPRPSTRVLKETATLPGIAADRRLEPAKLTRSLRGDLDWIVMKALEKERSRRYETANGLAMDIQRYLADEPVLASPPSTAYRLRKFLKRNKVPVVAAALVLLAFAGGMVGTTWQMFRAMAAERRAKSNEEKALTAAGAERKAKEEEGRQRKEAVAVAGLLEGLYRDVDPFGQRKDAVDLRVRLSERLDAAAAKLETDFAGDPVTKARLQQALGDTEVGIGDSRKALALFEACVETRKQTLGPDHPDTLIAMAKVARAYYHAGQVKEALARFAKVIGPLKLKLGAEDDETLAVINNAAVAMESAGQVKEALPLFEEVLKVREARLGPNHSETLHSLNNLAHVYMADGRVQQGLGLYQQCLDRLRSTLGAAHPLTLAGMNNLATSYGQAGQLGLAVPLAQEALTLRRAHLGPDHPDTLTTMNNLAFMYHLVGKAKEAVKLQEEALERMKATLGIDHPMTLTGMNTLGVAYQAAGRIEDAVQVLETALEMNKAKKGEDHPDTIIGMHNLAVAYKAGGRGTEALPLMEKSVKLAKVKLGTEHPTTLQFLHHLASTYQAQGRVSEAIPLFAATYQGFKSKFGMTHPSMVAVLENYLCILEEAREFIASEPVAREQLALMRQKSGGDLRPALLHVGLSLLAQEKFAEAEATFRETLAIGVQRSPDDWTVFLTQSLLGATLTGQKKYTDAEALLLSGYRGLEQRTAKIPDRFRSRLPESAERLAALYEAWGKPEDAKQWRAEAERARKGK